MLVDARQFKGPTKEWVCGGQLGDGSYRFSVSLSENNEDRHHCRASQIFISPPPAGNGGIAAWLNFQVMDEASPATA